MITTPDLNQGHVTANSLEEDREFTPPSIEPSLNGNGNGTPNIPDLEEHDQEESMDLQEVRGAIEALLFVSHEPVTCERLISVLDHVPKSVVKAALQDLQQECAKAGRGLQIQEVAGGFVMVTRPEVSVFVKRFSKTKSSTKLSRSALEALAIIGYKQPITRAEIEKIRGVETSGVLRTLLDQKLIKIVGRQDIPGRPMLYGTNKHFLQRFGLRDLRDLPPLKEFKDLGNSEAFPLELPFEATKDGESPPHVQDLSA